MYTVPFFHRGDTEAPQRPQRSQRRKRDAFFQRGHRGRIFFLLMFPSFTTAPQGIRNLLVGMGHRAPKPWTSIATTRPRSILVDELIILILNFLPSNIH